MELRGQGHIFEEVMFLVFDLGIPRISGPECDWKEVWSENKDSSKIIP